MGSRIEIPELSFVVLIGPSGSGKSTFARKHFKPTEVLSSDYFRGLVSDDENNQSASEAAFDALHYIAAKRLAAGRLTVIDATSVRPEDRKPLVQIAREFHTIPVAIVFNIPEQVCQERNATRADRNFGAHVIRAHLRAMRQSLRFLKRDGFRHVFIFDSPDEVDAAVIERAPLWNNRSYEHGPFDVIGDIHGCFDELRDLLTTLGYQISEETPGVTVASDPLARWKPGRRFGFHVTPPSGRKAVFLGDLVDRGPASPAVLRLVMSMVADGSALCVPGNHDIKLMRKLRGKNVQIAHGLAETLAQLEAEPAEFHAEAADFIDALVSHYVLDSSRLVVAHAGMKAEMQGRGSGAVRDFALYGETTGESDEFGLPERVNWAADYRGAAMVVYGHTPVYEPEWLNGTINIDTGCVFGGRLTALRYPERELVSVGSRRTYAEPRRPFLPDASGVTLSAQHQQDDVLDLRDVVGKRQVTTRLIPSIVIREENAAAALEVMSRFAVNPKWLIYLPPTMSPCETSTRDGFLEHPAEAFAYFRREGVQRVVCEQKHMGSRAVVVIGRDEQCIARRFGIENEGFGIVYTRTGRRFFDDEALERAVLSRLRRACDAAGFWELHKTDWACFDCELMPWSAKAQSLVRGQYAAVGAAARGALPHAIAALETAARSGLDVHALLARTRERLEATQKYVRAYQEYCWPVDSVDDMRLAPFHLLATESGAHVDRDHSWHMHVADQLCAVDGSLLLATPQRLVDLADPAAEDDATRWWESQTAVGVEGMVVKPLDFIMRGTRGLVQPAVKCRGREYLRIIYGPEYDTPENLNRLRSRALGAKRSLALREFALGVEGLERFMRRQPLRRVHECAFGVLALESQPVDPRL